LNVNGLIPKQEEKRKEPQSPQHSNKRDESTQDVPERSEETQPITEDNYQIVEPDATTTETITAE
jgi:hypothetical protein